MNAPAVIAIAGLVVIILALIAERRAMMRQVGDRLRLVNPPKKQDQPAADADERPVSILERGKAAG